MTASNVLISSAGRRVALMNIWRRSLASLGLEGKVFATDMSPLSSAFQSADEAFIVPRCTDPAFIPTMLELCRVHAVGIVVPTIDTELMAYALHRTDFQDIGTTVLVSSPETIAIAGNKESTHQWLSEKGFPTVRQTTVRTALNDPVSWPLPLLVKPSDGSASIGVEVVRDRQRLEAIAVREGYLVQSLAKGQEHTISVLVNASGKAVCAVPRRRLEVRAGEVSKGITVRDADLETLAKRLCEALPGARYALNTQIFKDEESGELNIIEINPRFGGGCPLAHEAGAEFARWILEETYELPSSASPDGWCDGLVMLRYDEAVFVNRAKVGQ